LDQTQAQPPRNGKSWPVEALKQIEKSFLNSRQTYGSPRVMVELRKMDIYCSESRVARLMKKSGFKRRTRRKFIPRWPTPVT
jgi:transposase InsO family protein